MTKDELVKRLRERSRLYRVHSDGEYDRGAASAYEEAAELADLLTSESSGPATTCSDRNLSVDSKLVGVSAGR